MLPSAVVESITRSRPESSTAQTNVRQAVARENAIAAAAANRVIAFPSIQNVIIGTGMVDD